MIRKNALLLVGILLLSSWLFVVPSEVKADLGSAKVYIICLSDVGGWSPGGSYDPSTTKEGSVDALLFKEMNSLPWVHPKHGEYPPFYEISYEVISTWYTYKYVVENYKEVIIVNTHGEITPVPSGYDRGGWTDEIAEAMLSRGVTWVHTAGYPFYYSWNQGETGKQLWGEAGFQRLMSHINKGSVTLPYDSETSRIDMNLMAIYTLLSGGWNDLSNARRVERGRPLRASDFKDYTILPIWGTLDGFMTGAVLVFAEPSERIAAEDRNSFGAYIHVGAMGTFTAGNVPTDGDYWRGFAGTAAAIWSEVQSFGPTGTHEVLTSDDYINIPYGRYAEFSLVVTPVITWYSMRPDGWFEIDVAVGILGFMKTNCSEGFGDVNFYAKPLTSDSQAMTLTNVSENGYRYGNPTLTGKYWEAGKTIINTIRFVIGVAGIATAHPEIALLSNAVGGVMLFSNWKDLLSTGAVTASDSGVDHWASCVDFMYQPQVDGYIDLGNGYRYGEFQSIIHMGFQVNMAERKQWTMFPIDWYIGLEDWFGGNVVQASGDMTLALFNNYEGTGYEATVFFEDFESDLDGWSVGDYNSLAGYDYWGIFDQGGIDAHELYCATVGTNSLFGERPNIIADPFSPEFLAYRYDKEMKAYATVSVDLRSYQSAKLRFSLDNGLFGNEGDYTVVEYGVNYVWTELDRYSGPDGGDMEFAIPITATQIRFGFVSNGDDDVSWGAFLDNIEIRAVLPNDAGAGVDAGDDFNSALYKNPGSYAGYLNYDEDWYRFPVTSSDITNGKRIRVGLSKPSNTRFLAELYNPSGQKKAGPSTSLSYTLASGDVQGNWRIRIYPEMGFGKYTFSISITTPGGGGGCPYVYVWNGHSYVTDNNILPASEISNGLDVKDYYQLQQKPVPVHERPGLSFYTFQIHEFEREHSYIDEAKLIAVDHDPDVNIALTQSGEILTYGNLLTPRLCMDNNGNNRLMEISTTDGDISDSDTFFQGYTGDFLILNFGEITAENAKLILRDDMKSMVICIEVQIPSQSEGWQTVEVLHPRDYWAIEAVDLTDYIPEKGDFLIRLLWTSPHRLDYVGLDTTPQRCYKLRTGVLMSAFHSERGNVLNRLKRSDDRYAQLDPGEKIWVTFALPNSGTAKATTFIFYTEGRYYTIS